MKRALLLSIILATAAFAARQTPAASDTQKLWALVIGVSNYAHAEPLRYAATDALAFSEFLKSPRGGGILPDHVFTLLEDQASRTGILVTLEELQDKVQPGDTVYVYLAGHGYTKTRVGYFIPSDGDLTSPAASAVNFSHLKDMVESGLAQTRTRVLVTDICNAGRIGPQTSETAQKIQNLINEHLLAVKPGNGTFLNLLASRPTEASWEREDLGGGVFTHTLLDALNGKAALSGEAVLGAKKLVDYLAAEVPRYTANQQHPMVNDGFDPALPMAFLDKPGPAAPVTGNLTTLALLNADRTPYVRIEWVDPRTQTKAMRPLAKENRPVQLGAMPTGDLELRLFDAENKDRPVQVKLQAGQNNLDLVTATLSQSRTILLASAALTPAMFQQAPPPPEATLAMRLDAGTGVFVDGAFWGNTQGTPVELRGLSPGVHNLALVSTPEREHRFRLRLFQGPHVFDLASGELRYINELQPSPALIALPQGLPANSANDYRNFVQALWEERLIAPAGNSAWDYFTRMQNALPAALRADITNRLVIAMGNRAQRTILKYVRGGDIRWNAAAFDEGAQLLARVRQLFMTNPEFESEQSFFQGRALIERGQYAEAVQQLQRSIQLDPEASHSQNAIGLALWKQNLLPEAIAPLQQAIALSPQWNYPRYTLALIYLEQRRYDEAEQVFQQALQNNTEDSTAQHGLGQLYALLGRFDESEMRLQQAVAFNPGNAYAYNTYGKLDQRRGRLAEAEQMFRLAIRLEPDEPAFRASLADLLRAAGRIPDAQAVFAQVASLAPDNLQVLQSYTAFLTSQNRAAEARTVFDQSIKKSPKNANLHVLYGGFLKSQGRAQDAEREYKEAVKISKTNAFAHHELATLYIEQKKVADAEKELQLATQADPRFGAPPRLLGQIRFAQRRYAEALDQYRNALRFSIEASQQQELRGFIADTEKILLDEKLNQAKGQADRQQYAAAWNTYADVLKATPDSTAARDAVLGFQFDHPADADASKLSGSAISSALQTGFWKVQVQAEQDWRAGRREQAAASFTAALEGLTAEDRRLVMATAFNVRNDPQGIHEVAYRWAGRLLELQKWNEAIGLMDLAARQNIFGVVPNFNPLTIDSLMWPSDIQQPRAFSDFEVAHHPDRRAHEIYASAYAGLGDWEKARAYLAALQSSPNDLTRATDAMRKWLPAGTELRLQ
jgi:tetratricopeptide (TPR) repeat protein